jgi:hypothetical protein
VLICVSNEFATDYTDFHGWDCKQLIRSSKKRFSSVLICVFDEFATDYTELHGWDSKYPDTII